MKNPEAFWFHFAHYVKQHQGQDIPIHYQEAAYLFGVLEETPDIENSPLSSSVKEKYAQFDQMAAQLNDLPIEEARRALEPMFGNTFYYDYYLMSNLPEY